MTLATVIDGERLYRVSGSAQFSFVNGNDARVLSVRTNGNGEFILDVNTKVTQQLICRVTNVSGWRATIDQRNVKLSSCDQVMFSIEVSPGKHEIVLQYWPKRFSPDTR